EAYTHSQQEATAVALESSPVSAPLLQFMEARAEWAGSASELLRELTALVGEQAARARDWPKQGNSLSGKLKRLAPSLRKAGIAVEIGREPGSSSGGRRPRRICLTKTGAKDRPPSSPTVPGAETGDDPGGRSGDDPGRWGDDPGDDPGRQR